MKHIKILKISWLFALIFATITCFAQDVSFTAQAPKYLKVGQQFQLTYSVNQKIDNLQAPSFSDFQELGGPSSGQSQSVQIINGKTSRSVTYTFTYYLRASKAGKFNLEPATARYNGKNIQSNALTIEVLGGNQQPSTGESANNNASTANTKEDLFVKLHVDKTSAYVGEQITAWVKIYSQVDLRGIDNGNQGPEFQGFYKQNVEVPELRQLTQEKVGNDIYGSGLLQKVILYPQKTGEIVIEPFTLNAQIQQRVNQPRSVFDDFFGTSYRTVNVPLKSNRVKITVKPLPGNGKPQNFSGAVGNFELLSAINTNRLKTNDALTIKVTISGTGNVKLIEGIETGFPSTFDVFDPSIKTSINNQNNGRSGSKTFEYTAIPRHAGEFVVRPFKFSFFNPSKGKYVTLQSPEYTISVEKGVGDTTAVPVISGINKQEIEVLGSDIEFIATDFKLKKQGRFFIANPLFYLAYIVPVLLFVLLLIMRRKQIKERADRAKYLNKRASKLAKKRLKKAKQMMTANNSEVFFEEVTKALWGYLSEKINIPASELTSDNARQKMMNKNVPAELAEIFIDIIEECEFARYAPGAAGANMDGVYDKASQIILKIDQKIKL